MNKKLGDDDGRAIDLLLDRAGPESVEGNNFIGTSVVLPENVKSAENILALLQQVPAADPPADLVQRTLRKIDEASAAYAAAKPIQPAVDGPVSATGDQQPSL